MVLHPIHGRTLTGKLLGPFHGLSVGFLCLRPTPRRLKQVSQPAMNSCEVDSTLCQRQVCLQNPLGFFWPLPRQMASQLIASVENVMAIVRHLRVELVRKFDGAVDGSRGFLAF